MQREVMDFIMMYVTANGMSPTLAEIAEYFGLRSLGTVHRHLRNLAEKGAIERVPGVSRGIKVRSQDRIAWYVSFGDVRDLHNLAVALELKGAPEPWLWDLADRLEKAITGLEHD